ncbi:PEP-CTERM sorting domain-containing protein [Accumulibacter sp.]|uniref:PEP-CTERM sorting domain-containing protein n=1 Tax=Accumulibacter sp. TaxID=2053492 RepID=UPI0025853631|nr:PEP-CTERM sorting domain-containing protein [Accumulibacter sp.]MCM8580720.1 PEP-CTERM sorting domain-containing protein [Accumulibacter sp.]MCM8622198.1 PEP-CTERM sorting domain-containing protein [Accumulibacter sp.]
MNFRTLCRIAVSALLIHLALPTAAAPIVYTITGTGSGHLGLFAFVDTAFTFTGTADTDDLLPFGAGVSIVSLTSMQVDVNAHGSAQPTHAFAVYVNNSIGGVGFLDELFGDVLDVLSPGLSSYDGISSVGPVAVQLDYLAPFQTTAGEFQLNTASTLTFLAILNPSTTPVPEPSISWLVFAGLVAAVMALRSRSSSPKPQRGVTHTSAGSPTSRPLSIG